jgi:diaminohydroxyphosphoribosylaminopyrimidine deaminase/5-amino-6-(5-phosphoribosylamino)uracil reductase
MADLNPQVGGRGLALLRAAGIEVEVGPLAAEARALNPGFIKRMTQGSPYCRCKLAASLDGRTAMASGESRWISSAASRRDVQRLRARHSAIVTGVATLIADDPSLNVRLAPADLHGIEPGSAVRQPWRVVVDSRLRTPTGARLLSLPGTTVIACCTRADSQRGAALAAAGARVVQVAEHYAQVDLRALMAWLAAEEMNEVLLETGPTLAGAALTAGLIDEFVLYIAPHLMGDGARGLFRLPGLEHMEHRIPLHIEEVRRIGPDLRLILRPEALSPGEVSNESEIGY